MVQALFMYEPDEEIVCGDIPQMPPRIQNQRRSMPDVDDQKLVLLTGQARG
jgi:hypothetical protein